MRAFLILLTILVGLPAVLIGASCAVEQTTVDDEPDTAEHLLTEEGFESIERRAYLVDIGTFAIQPGQWREGTRADNAADHRVRVVDTDPLRIVSCTHNICTLAFVEHDSLQPVPARTTTIAESGQAQVEVAPGTRLEISGPTDQRTDPLDVRVNVDGLQASGTIEPAELHEVYVQSHFEPIDTDYALKPPAHILESPGGEPIASVEVDASLNAWHPVQIEGKPTDGYRKIVLHNKQLRIQGWVDDTAIQEGGALFGRSTLEAGEAWGTSARTAFLPEDTWLYLDPDGERIARTVGEAKVIVGSKNDQGWHSISYLSAWGLSAFEVVVPPGTLD